MQHKTVEAFYRDYIACLNSRDLTRLDDFVGTDVHHNGRRLGVDGYRAMIEKDCDQIPDLRFTIELIVADPTLIGVRLAFDCHPEGEFLGVAVDGRRVRFSENVFYEIRDGRIDKVWSVIDKQAIERQVEHPPSA